MRRSAMQLLAREELPGRKELRSPFRARPDTSLGTRSSPGVQSLEGGPKRAVVAGVVGFLDDP